LLRADPAASIGSIDGEKLSGCALLKLIYSISLVQHYESGLLQDTSDCLQTSRLLWASNTDNGRETARFMFYLLYQEHLS
jgi:hypothetical protein